LKAGTTFPLTQNLPDGDPKKVSRVDCCGLLKKDALTHTLNGTWPRKRLDLKTGKYEADSDKEPYTGVIVGARAMKRQPVQRTLFLPPRQEQPLGRGRAAAGVLEPI